MWSRLTRRLRRRAPTQLDLSAVDRLGDLVARIVALLPEDAPVPEAAPPEPRAEPLAETATLLFVPSPSGYTLADAAVPLARGARVARPEGDFRVLRLGPSPLPGDPRRCAFLEREEPPGPERTSDA